MNNVVVVGKIDKVIDENNILIKVPRMVKKEISTDYIPVKSLNGFKMLEFGIGIGETIGIRGRIASEKEKIFIEAEKITFLSSKNNNIVGVEE